MSDYTDSDGGEWNNIATSKPFNISVRVSRPPSGEGSMDDLKEKRRAALIDKVNEARNNIINSPLEVDIVAGTFSFQMDEISREKIQHTHDRFTQIEAKRVAAGRSMTWRTADNQSPAVVVADLATMIDEAESRWVTTHDDAVDLKTHIENGTQPPTPLMDDFGISQSEIDDIL